MIKSTKIQFSRISNDFCQLFILQDRLQKSVHMYKPIMGKFIFSSYSEKSPQLLFNLKTTLTVKFVLNLVLLILFLSMKWSKTPNVDHFIVKNRVDNTKFNANLTFQAVDWENKKSIWAEVFHRCKFNYFKKHVLRDKMH